MSVFRKREYLLEAFQNAHSAEKPTGLSALLRHLPWAARPRRLRRASADMLCSPDSYLRTSGWLQSRRDKSAVDPAGKPLPWFTYPSIQFLDGRIKPAMQVFEYGSGASTLWWASRVSAVAACEYDAAWYQRLAGIVPGNVRLIHAPDPSTYAQQILADGRRFDVVVIDGEVRNQCAHACVGALKPGGAIVWDNAERAEYQEGFDFLAGENFRRLDFDGLGPINVYGWRTSVFYRSDNCLGI